MDYETKFKEAIERARIAYKDEDKHLKATLERIFPELKMSEDESIIRDIRVVLESSATRFFKENGQMPVWYGRTVAWLEKQNMGISEATKKELEDNLNKALEKETQESWNEFLDEKKPYGQRQECVDCQMNYAGECKGSCAMKRSEQNLVEKYNITGIGSKHAEGKLGEMLKNITDKTEPKFHEGDWVVRGNTTAQILGVFEQYYVGLDIDGNGFTSGRFLSDDKIHLWSIKDAKPGDVLTTDSGRPFIFKGCLDEIHPNSPVAYCGINCDDDFYEGSDIYWWTDENVYPATKEQRDTLMKSMNDSGYIFDFEKKELKKIEQKEDVYNKLTDFEVSLKHVMEEAIECGDTHNLKADADMLLRIAHKPAKWSEEDENRINRLIAYFEDKESFTAEDDVVYANYLNSLKDRYTWKPSDEQMEALDSATENCAYSEYQDCLKELIGQLKKLREEI